jgi:hypothetical protein
MARALWARAAKSVVEDTFVLGPLFIGPFQRV